MADKNVRPGQRVKDSGIYESSKSHERATMVQGEKAPPTPKAGEQWRQVHNTNPDRRK
jgi:hypothetical protein